MEELKALMEDVIGEKLLDLVISGAKSGDVLRVRIRPVSIKNQLLFQVARHTEKQVFHENLEGEALKAMLPELILGYKQVQIRMTDRNVTVLVSKKGKATIKSKKADNGPAQVQSHNREKQYILEEGIPVPFMIDLGVMTETGKIVRTKYDKYRQINRFLEFIEDILPELPTDRTVTIIDFGCGKSYLTFAMYYYLKVLKHYDLRVIGLDLKEAVIAHCNCLAESYGYEGLTFLCGDIKDFEGVDAVDMVVTLHACDTATDFAIHKAVGWKAGVILSVPCCQHELNRKIEGGPLAGAFKYGLIQERTAALMTDALRGQLLEIKGYKVQLMEFIDMEHTPKNILIRAVKQHKMMPASAKQQKLQSYLACRDFLGGRLTLDRLFEMPEKETDSE